MKITHVVRGEDLLSSTPRQIAVYRAMGVTDEQTPELRAPAVRDGPGQRQAVQAQRRGVGRVVPRARASCPRRCATTWRCSAGRSGGDREEFTLAGDGAGVHPRPGEHERRPLRPEEARGDQRRQDPRARRRRTSSRRHRCRSCSGAGLRRPTRRRPSELATARRRPRRWSRSGWPGSPRPPTCSAFLFVDRGALRVEPESAARLLTADAKPVLEAARRGARGRSPGWPTADDRGGAARGADRGPGPQAQASPSAPSGSPSPAAGSRRRCSSRWSCSAASARWPGCGPALRRAWRLTPARGALDAGRLTCRFGYRVDRSGARRARSGVVTAPMGYGVIGSPTDSGSVSLGSSPGTPALRAAVSSLRSGSAVRYGSSRTVRSHAVHHARAPLCSGLARRPLKAVARVRIPSGLQGGANPLVTGGFVVHPRSA